MKGWWPTSYLLFFLCAQHLHSATRQNHWRRPQHIWPKGLKMIYGFDRIWWNSFGWYYKHARMMLYLKCWPFFSQDPFFSVPHSTKKSPMLTSGSSTPYASAILGRGWTEWKHPRVAQRSDAFVTLRDSILLDLGQGKHGSKIGKERIFNTFTNLVDVLTRWVYFQDPLINMIYHDWFLDGGTFGVWTLTALSLYIIYLYKSLTVSLSLSLECFGVDLWFLLVGDMHQHVMKFSSARAYSSGGGGDFWLNDVVSLSNLGCWAFFWLQKSSTVRLRLTFETFCSYLWDPGMHWYHIGHILQDPNGPTIIYNHHAAGVIVMDRREVPWSQADTCRHEVSCPSHIMSYRYSHNYYYIYIILYFYYIIKSNFALFSYKYNMSPIYINSWI